MKSQIYFSIIHQDEMVLRQMLVDYDELFLKNEIEGSTIRNWFGCYVLRFENGSIKWDSSEKYTQEANSLFEACRAKHYTGKFLEIYDGEYYLKYSGKGKSSQIPPDIQVSMVLQ